ncbi:hypothetical protein M3704_00290 [Mannheimia haemolytica]|nr:hypothetical protein M3704_00290 [Mannheimia haemolytica]STY62039.1 Uncharacterised protein [Mannheimia haemolytica]
MKKIVLAGIMSATFALTGCSEKDKAYYLQNIDKAQTKVAECENKLKEAWKNKDENALKTLEKDAECNAAIQAVKEDRKIKAEQARKAAEAKAREEIDREKAKIKQELGQADWKAVAHYVVNSSCAKYVNQFSKTGFAVPKDNYACKAIEEIHLENLEAGKAELLKFPYDELRSQEKEYCAKDKRPLSACFIWEQALGEQAEKAFEAQDLQTLEKQKSEYAMFSDKQPISAKRAFEKAFKAKEEAVIENYTKNYEQLKQDYNQCVEKVKQIGDHYSKHEQRSAVTNFYPCSQAQAARRKLGLSYDNFQTPME